MSPHSQQIAPLPDPSGPRSFTPPESDDDEDGAGVDLSRLISAVVRYRYLVLSLAAAGTVAGFGISKLLKPIYEAQASIQITTGAPAGMPETMRAAPILEGGGWVELMRSFSVLDQVVIDRQLYIAADSPSDLILLQGLNVTASLVPGRYRVVRTDANRIQLRDGEGALLAEAAPGDSIGQAFGFSWVPQELPMGREIAFGLQMPRDAAIRLREDLSVTLPGDGALLRIALRGTDPRETAITLNAVASRYERVALVLKREKLTTVTEDLREQLENARVELERAEVALESFKVNTITLPTDRDGPVMPSGLQETRDPVRQAFFTLKTERDGLTRDRDAINRALALAADSGRAMVIALGTIPAARESRAVQNALDELNERRAALRQARLVFSAERPEVQQLERQVADLERVAVPNQLRALVDNLGQRISDLDLRLAASSREMQQIPARVTEENRLERAVDVAELIYTQLQSAYEQARLSELSATVDVRVLDSAVPPTRPVRDQMLLVLAGGVMGGLGVGLLLAIVLDRFDTRIRYPAQVTGRLGLPILGAVPLLKGHNGGPPGHDDLASLMESMRSIRMALLYAHGAAGSFVTTVTSPGPGEGKSFISLQLAKSFAQSGRRTLLIDGDSRRGVLHRTLAASRKPGLTDVLSGKASLEEAIRRDPDGAFDLIPCGTRRASAPELLASPQMMQLMVRLRGEYDAIVVDSPPMGAGIDPFVLASLCGTLVLVLRTGQTDGALAEARLGDVARLPVRVLGAILNDVKPSGAYRYYSYLPGYRSADEDEVSPDGPPLLGVN
jgi:capsular exopolysaccharide synthesis family protein